MNDAVKEVITGMTDSELLEAVEKTYSGYTREALEIAMAELKRRGVPFIDKTADYPPAGEASDTIAEERDEEVIAEPEYYCPQCKNKMESGTVYLRSTGWGLLFYGASYKHCFFKPLLETEDQKVIANNESRPA